jgi:predicted nucleic acid-binding protein
MPTERQRFVLDATVLVSVVNSDDEFHLPCYQFFRERHEEEAIWVVPGLILFEFEATQSRRYRERGREAVYRSAPLYETNTELYDISYEFMRKVSELKLFDLFAHLRGADLVYGCIAKVEGLPIVTHDAAFKKYRGELEIIDPVEVNADLLRV